MNPAATVLALALAQPTQVFEEWELLDDAPLREAVTARAAYLRAEGPRAQLPAAVQGDARPEAWALGWRRALPVGRAHGRWYAVLPPGDRAEVRVVARVVRAAPAPRLFRTAWPRMPDDPAPVRRVAAAPRDWVEAGSHAWTCPAEAPDVVPCVSAERAPGALVTRVSALPSPRGAAPLAAALVALALAAVGWREGDRAERLLGAAGGVAVALAAALALVGAYRTSWGVALAALAPGAALVGALAPRRRVARGAGALALVAAPLAAVAGVDARAVLAGVVTAALVVATAGLARDDG